MNEMIKHLKLKNSEINTYWNLLIIAKAVLKGKIKALNIINRKQKKLKASKLSVTQAYLCTQEEYIRYAKG